MSLYFRSERTMWTLSLKANLFHHQDRLLLIEIWVTAQCCSAPPCKWENEWMYFSSCYGQKSLEELNQQWTFIYVSTSWSGIHHILICGHTLIVDVQVFCWKHHLCRVSWKCDCDSFFLGRFWILNFLLFCLADFESRKEDPKSSGKG